MKTALSGGATVTDSDPGSGESWGRSDGRTFGFSNFDTSQFTSLTWQVVDTAIAFDGTINARGETLTRDASASTGTEQVWRGTSTIRNSGGGSSGLF